MAFLFPSRWQGVGVPLWPFPLVLVGVGVGVGGRVAVLGVVGGPLPVLWPLCLCSLPPLRLRLSSCVSRRPLLPLPPRARSLVFLCVLVARSL